MAKLWEDTVVTVIRDEKWLHAIRHGVAHASDLPLPQLKLRGNAEQRVGDLLDVLPDDRFYLMEVKAGKGDISDEWKTKNEEKQNQKDAIRACRAWMDVNDSRVNKKMVAYSLRGHLLAYWVDEVAPQMKVKSPLEMSWMDLLNIGSCVVVTPYILGCRAASMTERNTPASPIMPKQAEDLRVAIMDPVKGEFYVREHIPLSLLYHGDGYLVSVREDRKHLTVLKEWELGLSLIEMQDYVAALCSFAGPSFEKIHAVLMSRSGKFFRVMTTTADLSGVLDPAPGPDYKFTPRVEKIALKLTAEAEAKMSPEQPSSAEVSRNRGPRRSPR